MFPDARRWKEADERQCDNAFLSQLYVLVTEQSQNVPSIHYPAQQATPGCAAFIFPTQQQQASVRRQP